MKKRLPHLPLAGGFWMILAGASFACINTVLQYLGMNLGIASTISAFFQYSFALLVLLFFLDKIAIQNILATKNKKWHFLRILVSVIGIQLWTLSLTYVPIWQGIALLMTSPLFATLGSGVMLGEKVSPMRWLATLLGFCGAMLILAPWTDDFTFYALLPILAAMFWAMTSLLTKYTLNEADTPLTIVAYMLIFMLPVNSFFVVTNFELPNTLFVWILLVFAGALTAFGQWAIAKAYASADASFVQPFDHIKLPLNVLAGFIVFEQVPPGQLWLGAFLIIFSISAISFYENARKKTVKLT